MKKKTLALTFTITLALFGATNSTAQLSQLETEHLRLVYFGGLSSFLTPHAARCFENAFMYHSKFWNYSSKEKVTVALFDTNDHANAGALATPENRIVIYIAPASFAFETVPSNERMNSLMNHEMVHIVALDQASGRDNFFRAIFQGKVEATNENPSSILFSYLTNPRRSAPRWYHEGIAVFLQTWMSGGIGRAMGAYDEMVFRSMVLDSSRFYDPISIETEGVMVDFQVGSNSYLYGTRFMSYLALKYGPETLTKWVSRVGGSKSYFASQFKNVYGLSMDKAWSEWVTWEHEFQRKNLDSIGQYTITEYRPISMQALGSVSRSYFDSENNKLYSAVNYPGQLGHLASIDVTSGDLERICDIKGPAVYFVSSVAFDPKNQTLFYTTDNDDWRDLASVNLKTGKKQLLQKDIRVGDLTFCKADSSIWGVRHFNGYSTLVRIAPPYDKWDQIRTWPYGKDIYDIDISPDGKRISAGLSEVSGRQTLIEIDVEAFRGGDSAYTTLFDFGNSIAANFIYSDDGNFLYGSSYLTGISNIFRYDFAADSMEALSNCETGFFRPIPTADDSLIVFRYTGKGFVPVKIAEKVTEDINPITFLGQRIVEESPQVKDWIAASPGEIDLDTMIVDSGDYNGLAHLALASAYPIVEGYKDFPSYGLRFNFAEPIGIHTSELTISFSPDNRLPDDEKFHLKWSHDYSGVWTIDFSYNSADFYDLFGPTKTSRKGYSLGITRNKILLSDYPKETTLSMGLTGYSGLEKLPDFQNVSSSFDKFLSYNISLSYKNQRASLGAVDYEKGVSLSLSTYGNYVNRRFFPQVRTDLNLGFPLPISHSALWFRSSAGYAYGDREEPFANFYFGGFGNNWVDYQTEKRYRRFYSFPGLELNQIKGRNFGRLMAEWILPRITFRRLGVSTLYASWTRLALFSTALVTNFDRNDLRKTVGSVGAQLDIRMTLLSHIKATFSVGYAKAVEKNQRPTDEFMASLRLL